MNNSMSARGGKFPHSHIFHFSLAIFFVGAVFIISLSFFSLSANSATTSEDAIAIRVLPNTNHYSPVRWYSEQGFSGSPQAMLVDGYEAVRDGRTVYVNVANVVGTKLYTNIYLISYNQAAESSTLDIFGKILAHWKFNTNILDTANSGMCLSKSENINSCFNSVGGLRFQKFDAEPGSLSLHGITENDGGNNVYSVTNYSGIASSDFLPINTSKKYYLSGKFKSVGTRPSIIYFGFIPYDKNKNRIDSSMVLRVGNDAKIVSFDNNKITALDNLTNWHGAGNVAHLRSLGFYFDGNTNKLPDKFLAAYPATNCLNNPYAWASWSGYCLDDNFGAYSTVSGKVINLNNPILSTIASRIIPGVTVVKNHHHGGTYLYAAASGATVPNEWIEYKAVVTDEAFNSYSTFWPETKYAKLLILANYNQNPNNSYAMFSDGSTKLYFDDITYASEECANVFNGKTSKEATDAYNDFVGSRDTCYSDGDCGDGGSYCNSSKGSVIRDTRRLADLAEMEIALENYKDKFGIYPKITSGTYLANKSISTWPSWNATLGAELGITMPVDPINKLGNCGGDNYDAITCWDAANKKFADRIPENNQLDLPLGSNVYTYSASADGSSYSLNMGVESGNIDASGFHYTYSGGGVGADGNASGTSGMMITEKVKVNQAPIFTGANLPLGIKKMPYTGYVEAVDKDGDYLAWSLATVGDWSSWPVQPVLQDTGVKNQKKIYSSQAGELGDYVFSITVNDSKGGSYTTTDTIKIKNYCKDDDGDGYGVSPKSGKAMGCAYDGDDCDDTPGAHIKNGAYGDVNIDGDKINPAQPDNCTQYDGLDNNCNGQIDENAQTQGLLSNVDFESGSVGGVPSGWSGSGQDRSSVGLTQSNAHSGIQSVLIHQSSNVQYPGVCSQAYCDDLEYYYSGDCAWDNSTKKCKFTAPDTCHSGGNAVYAEGESFCWGHSNTRDWAYLSYNVSSLPFNPGDTYIIYFYYKGNVAFGGSLYPSFGYSLGWHGQCYGQSDFAYWPCSSNAYGGYSPTDPDLCLIHAKSAANQTSCYPAIYMPAVADNNYINWTYYSTSFYYTSELAQVKDDSGNKAHNFGLSVGYNTTGAAGSDLYIDDFKLVKCVNK